MMNMCLKNMGDQTENKFDIKMTNDDDVLNKTDPRGHNS